MKRVAEICQALIATGKYEPKKDAKGDIIETYCNFFVRDVAGERGYPGLKNFTANSMVAFFDGSPEWEEVTDLEKVQVLANDDKLVAAAYAVPGGHGHVCVVVPGQLCYSGQRQAFVPIVANVGKDCFYGKPLSFAFSKTMTPIRYFMLRPGEKGGY
jgi:hypothetical protein